MATIGKFYGVANGHCIGVFASRELCETSVRGFPGAVVRSFDTYAAAANYIAEYCLSQQRRNRYISTVHERQIEHPTINVPQAMPVETSQTVTSTARTSQRSERQTLLLPLFTDADCSEEQRKILALVSQGANIFVTGSAGVGKSFVIRKICQLFESKGLQRFSDFFVTASTGIAAVQIGGMTAHSFAGFGLAEDGIIQLKQRVTLSARATRHWADCRTLIIDEVSMISDDFFDKLDAVGRYMRQTDLPFGGIQLILCGDFFQLPPVAPAGQKRRCPNCGGFDSMSVRDQLKCLNWLRPDYDPTALCGHIYSEKIRYIFQSDAWRRANLKIFELTKPYRQTDADFVSALEKTRLGKPDFEALHIFKQCCWDEEGGDSIKPTKLYSSRALVEQENTREFNKLTTIIHKYQAIDRLPAGEGHETQKVLDKLQAGKDLRLRVGMQVMLVANLNVSEGLVNGSRGIVVGFVDLAEAASQLENQGGLRSDDESRDLAMFARGADMKFPKVLFKVRNVPKLAVITPYSWKVALDYRLDAYRIQIPLIAAWALTIHKCQGMTLEKCEVDLNRCFGFGMAYVALSRSKSREGLRIIGWKGGKEIRADPVVEEFYKSIERNPR